MRLATPAALGIFALLAGCGQPVAPVAVEAKVVSLAGRARPLQCNKYAGAEHHTEKCAVEIVVELPTDKDWSRFGCYGELEFSQVYEGRVSTPEHGFYVGFDRQPHMKAGEFPLIAFVYFPEGYGALDPSLKWYECKVWYADSAVAT